MKWILPILIVLAAFVIGFGIGKNYATRPVHSAYNTTTVRDTVVDTIPYRLPIPFDSVVLRYEIVKLPVRDTVLKIEHLWLTDSVDVEIPIHQKEYQDSLYHVWVSGYQAKLDSINIYSPTVTVMQTIKEPRKRWGVGIQLGAGYDLNAQRVSPYIGVGISYNIFSW